MTASLYQSAASVDDCSLFASATSRISLASEYTEDVRRKGLRVEADEVAPAAPGIAAAAEQVFHLVLAAFAGREVDPARLHELGIEVDDDQNHVEIIFFTESQKLIVIGRMELQAPV